jgi:hypothetical protein
MSLSGCTLIDAQLTGGATVVAASSFKQTTNANHGFIYESGGSTSSFSVSGSRFVGFYSTTPITSATQGFRGSFFSSANRYNKCVPIDTNISYTGAFSYADHVRDASYSTLNAVGVSALSPQHGKISAFGTAGGASWTVTGAALRSLYPGAKTDVTVESQIITTTNVVFDTTSFNFTLAPYAVATSRVFSWANTPVRRVSGDNRMFLVCDSGTQIIA